MIPWAWLRRKLAHRWHVPSWVVDEAPYDEVLTELEIMQLTGELLKI